MKQFILRELERGQIKNYKFQINEDIYTLQIGKSIRVYFKVRVQPNYLDLDYFIVDTKFFKDLQNIIDAKPDYEVQGFYCFSIERQKYLFPLQGIDKLKLINSTNGKSYILGSRIDLKKSILKSIDIA